MLTKEQEEYLLNPPPGSAAERAKEFGIDLTLTVENLKLTLEQRIRRLNAWREAVRELRADIHNHQSSE
jgi:hypothetical protein